MFNILIVDDEAWIRKGIVAKLNNLDLPINKIIEADSSELAIQLIELEDIHIVLSDIRMGDMDGLQLISSLKKQHHMKFVVISGYAEFDYAKKALELEVSGYLLKPVKEKELGEVLNKVIDELSQGNPMDKKQYVLEQQLNNYFHNSGLPMDIMGEHKYMAMAILNIELGRYDELTEVKTLIARSFESERQDFTVDVFNNYKNNKQMLIVFLAPTKEAMQKAKNYFLFSCYQKIRELVKSRVVVGVSNTMESLSRELYEQASVALLNKFISNGAGIYYYKRQVMNDDSISKELKRLEKYMECKDMKNIRSCIDSLFSVEKFNEDNIVYIRYYYNEIVYFLRNSYRDVISRSKSWRLLKKEVSVLFYDNLNQVKSEMIAFVEDHASDEEEGGGAKEVIYKAKDYVDRHYDEDMTIKELAYKVGINPNYLSTLFKKETGKTFTKYLTDLRIDNAKLLLAETGANVSQISRSVGYQDPGYFYRVFKKETGQTPLNFRKKLLKNENE